MTVTQSPSKLATHCNGCVFAEYEKSMQSGCKMRYMPPDQYSYEPVNNTLHRVFYRQCQFYRNNKWVTDPTLNVERVQKEVEIKYKVFINSNNNPVELNKTLDSLKRQRIQPTQIVVVEYSGKGDKTFEALQQANLQCEWVLEEFLEDVPDWRDSVLLKFKSGAQLFCFVETGFIFPDILFELLNKKVNYNDLRFTFIEGEDILIIPYGIYYIGNPESPLREILDTETGYNYEDLGAE